MSSIRLLFARHLLLANTLTCGLQGATGDFLEQLLTGRIKEKGWTYEQTAIMCGAKLLLGPPLHLFYHILDGRKFTGTKSQVVLKKLFWDTLCNPCISFTLVTSLLFFFSGNILSAAAILEGISIRAAVEDYKRKFFDYFKIDFILWPCGMFINFYFMPHHYRILFVNAIALVDCTLLSFIRKREELS